jgi:hypothetical protein
LSTGETCREEDRCGQPGGRRHGRD